MLKNDVIQGAGYMSKNDITWGQASSTCHPTKKVNKAEELTYLSINISSTPKFWHQSQNSLSCFAAGTSLL
jgi:hypothetical protein